LITRDVTERACGARGNIVGYRGVRHHVIVLGLDYEHVAAKARTGAQRDVILVA
jgi:hypothetical protein